MQPPTRHTRTGVPCDEQTVAFGGKLLEDSSVLAQVGVSDEQTLYVLMRVLGGAKKRKKKTYTKPKKQKHKHKKIKLRVLQFYKVRGEVMRRDCTICSASTGGGWWQGAAPAQDLPRLRPRHLHGYHV